MVLRFSGDVGRLVQVVSLGEQAMGFVGIEKDRAAWPERQECVLRGWNPAADRGETALERAYLEALGGRAVDRTIGRNSIGMLSLPSGKPIERVDIQGQKERRDGLTGQIWKRARSALPVGLIKVAPKTVVAPVAVFAYEPLN